MSDWAGFWIFMAALVISDCWMLSQGYEGLLQTHKTPEEKEIQRLKIEILRKQAASEEKRK